MTPFKTKTKVVASAVVALLLAAVVSTWHYTGAVYRAEISKIKETAATEVAKHALATLEKEREIKKLQTKIEQDFIEYENKLITANDRFNARLSDSFRLRDKNASGCAAGADSTTTDSGDGSGGAELSKEATEFLWGESSRADRVAGRLALCQQYVEILQGQLGQSPR